MNDEELTIVTDSNDNHIFRLKNFQELDDIVAEVAMEACKGTNPYGYEIMLCVILNKG